MKRKTTEARQPLLFDVPSPGSEDWWGMPSFEMGDARPQHRVTINFATEADLRSFSLLTGIPLTTRSDTAWYPHEKPLRGRYYYSGPPTPSRYPVCIPSKGRAKHQKTGHALDRLGVQYRFFVEETEADDYIAEIGRDRVVVMPFHDLGQGSIPARNFIWEWAQERGHARHWVVDDNIVNFYRTHANRRLTVRGGGFFAAMEDFADRYANLALCGPHDIAFVPDRSPNLTPVLWNTRVYSCILIRTDLPHRWRGRYNEDTDLSLRLLKDGYATCVFRALCMDKPGTSGSKSAPTPGGNTDHVYNTGDHRRAFAESLRDQHPDVVTVSWKFNRWHHSVDYRPFIHNDPKLAATPTVGANEYGMNLFDGESDGNS